MPLSVEIKINEIWRPISTVSPGGQAGSISNNRADGERELYILECASDDTSSTISKSEGGMDSSGQDERDRVVLSVRSDVIAVLRENDKPFELTVTPDNSTESRTFRFAHVKLH